MSTIRQINRANAKNAADYQKLFPNIMRQFDELGNYEIIYSMGDDNAPSDVFMAITTLFGCRIVFVQDTYGFASLYPVSESRYQDIMEEFQEMLDKYQEIADEIESETNVNEAVKTQSVFYIEYLISDDGAFQAIVFANGSDEACEKLTQVVAEQGNEISEFASVMEFNSSRDVNLL